MKHFILEFQENTVQKYKKRKKNWDSPDIARRQDLSQKETEKCHRKINDYLARCDELAFTKKCLQPQMFKIPSPRESHIKNLALSALTTFNNWFSREFDLALFPQLSKYHMTTILFYVWIIFSNCLNISLTCRCFWVLYFLLLSEKETEIDR